MQEWINKTLYEKITEIWESENSLYSRVNDARDTIIEHFRPDMDTEVGSRYDSRLLGHDIYDGTGVNAVNTMAVGFYAHQYSKNTDWINYKFALDILKGVDELDIFASEVRDHMTQVYQRGNFYEAQLPYAKNAITIGSPCSFGEEIKGEVLWTPLHYTTFRLYYDRFDRPVGVIIKEKMKLKDMYDKFCEGVSIDKRNAKAQEIFSTSTMSLINAGQWTKKLWVWRAVFKRIHPIWYGKDYGKRYKYWDCYYEDVPKDENKPLMTAGYFVKPFVVWNYEKNPWEGVSRTPAFYSLYDDVTLNNIMYHYITDVQRGANPPAVMLKEMKGQYALDPGERVYLERDQWEYQPKIIQKTGNIQWEVEQIKMFRGNVKKYYKTDLFTVLTELALTNKQPITATQTLEIKDEKITQISPMIESNDNYLRQVDERVMDIEFRAGRGPFRRDYMMYIADVIAFTCKKNGIPFNGNIVPEFTGKLRKQQQTQQKLKPLQLGLEYAGMVRDVLGEDTLIAMKGYNVLDKGLNAVDFPMDAFKTEEEFNEDLAELNEQRSQQLQFENMVEAAKATKGQKVE